jgi:hypothetical protein
MTRRLALALCVCVSWVALTALVRAENPFDDDPPAAQDKAAADNPFEAPREQAAKKDQPGRQTAAVHPDPALEANIREALQRPTKMEFTETPLQDAVDFLKDYHGIEIQLDNRALENEGIGSDTPITRHISGMSLGSALRLLLADIDATFVVRPGTLLITTKAAAARMIDLRVYAIDELVGDGVEPAEIAEVLQVFIAPSCQATPGAVSPKPAAPAERASAAVTMVPFHNLLVIRGTQADHDEIEKLFGQLKAKLKSGD